MTAVKRKQFVQLDSKELDDSTDGAFLHTRVGDQRKPEDPGSPMGVYLGKEIDLSRILGERQPQVDGSMMVDLAKEAEAAVVFGFYSVDRVPERRPSIQETRWAGSEQDYYRSPQHLSKVFRRSVESGPRSGRNDRADRSNTPEGSSKQLYKMHRSEAFSRNWNEQTTNTQKFSQYTKEDLERLYRSSKRTILTQRDQAHDGYNKLLETRIRAAHKVIQQTESMKVVSTPPEKPAQSIGKVSPRPGAV